MTPRPLILPPRYSTDSITVWRAARPPQWETHRLASWRVPEPLVGSGAAIYAEPLFAHAIAEPIDTRLIEPSLDWLTHLPESLLRRAVAFATLADARGLTNPAFIKPADDKCFPASVYANGPSLSASDDLPPDTAVLIAEPVGGELFEDYGDLPRGNVNDRIYNATPYPSDKAIGFHNEGVHTGKWPRRIIFYCRIPAERDGQTPIVDCRQIVAEMDPDLRELLATKGIRYVRNFTFEQDYRDGLDVSWKEFFRTSDKAEVEAICRANGNDFAWFANDRLRISRTSPAIVSHPVTGDLCFISQLETHHLACLDPELRQAVQSIFREDELPRHAYFGDGTPIPDGMVEHLTGLCWGNAFEFTWRAGDVLMVDNMLMAHARRPFSGKRHIMVSMSDMVTAEETGVVADPVD